MAAVNWLWNWLCELAVPDLLVLKMTLEFLDAVRQWTCA